MYIVDSHVHIWGANTPQRPWPPGRSQPHRATPFSKEDLLCEMNSAGVERAVTVPPSFEGERNDVVLAAAHAHPKRFAAMGRLNTEMPGSRGLMKSWRQQGLLGLRCTFHTTPFMESLIEGRVDWLWAEAEQAGVPIYVLVRHPLAHHIARVAERYPTLKLVMDHLSLTTGHYDDEAFGGLDKVLALAKHANVAIKVSALPCFTKASYPYYNLQPYIRRVYDAFGPRRMFWGSDLTRLPCSYIQAITMFTEEIAWLTHEDLEWIMGRGVCEWLDWPLLQ